MSHKFLTQLRARAENGVAYLSARKSVHSLRAKNDSQDPFRIIRVYRKEEPDFVFNEDYAEYFDGVSQSEAKLIFEGHLPAHNDLKFIYEDRDVETGMTYTYWVACGEGDPIGPVPVKIRDPEVWWSQDRIDTEIAAMKSQYPDMVRVECIGHTVLGREINAIKIGAATPAVALVGAIHPGESGPELIIPAIGRILAERGDILSRVGIVAIPSVNIDERERLVCGVPWYLRTNTSGVDLNRNFPANWDIINYSYGLDSSDPTSITYRGPSPASEPETRAVTDFLKRTPVEAIYSFHCLASICGMRMGGAKAAGEDPVHADKCSELSLAYLQGMASDASLTKDAEFFCTDGSLPAWCHHELGIPAFDIEISFELEQDALALCRIDKTDLPLLQRYQQRHTNGILSALETIAASQQR